MVGSWVVSAGLEALSVPVAAVGAARLARWHRVTGEPRLQRLAGFFALYALAAAAHLSTVGLLGAQGDALDRTTVGLLDVAFWLHHGLLLAALALAVAAVGRPRWPMGGADDGPGPGGAAVLAPVLLAAEPLLGAVEALVLLYLAVATAMNHARRSNVGSLQGVAGFLLLLAAQATFLLDAAPLGPRDPWGAALALAGIAVLALAAPRWRGRRG